VLTQSSMQLEELIGKYLVGQGDAGKAGDKPKPENPQPNDKNVQPNEKK